MRDSSVGKAVLTDTGNPYDVAIIGAGVVGCAVARKFALAGAKVILIEKGSDILSGASKANSAILHTGFDAPPGSLELELVKAGRQEYLDIKESLSLSLVKTGALVCAWTDEQDGKLEDLAQQGRENGIADLRVLSGEQARATMPSLSQRLISALEVDGEHVIDPWTAPLAYITQAVKLGAVVMISTELVQGVFNGDWLLQTTNGDIHAKSVVNSAGLYGDIVDERLGFQPQFTIKPRKGQFVVLDKASFKHVPRIILPVPTEITKGIVVCPTAFGNVIVGPTAEEQDDRVRATVEKDTLKNLLIRASEIVPALASIPVCAAYAGLRPASESKDYRVFVRAESRAITLGGIRSTGLSSSLGLAQHAVKLHAAFGLPLTPPAAVPTIKLPNLTETQERDWQRPDHGEIVCHCELVTRREIEAALVSDVPAQDYGGLRRRTRAGMGRCQGFYCNAHLAEITKGKLVVSLDVSKEGEQ